MAEQDLQVVGVVRFSVATSDYYSETHGSPEAPKVHLFDPDRLALCFETFEKLCLPSMIHQTDQDFRLDDDDALSLDYIARLKAIAAPLRSLQPERPTAISFNRGFYVEMTGQGGNTLLDTTERAPLSCGTALLKPASYGRNPYGYNHRAVAQHYTVYSDISAPVFLRTIHRDYKSSPAKLGITGQMTQAQIKEELVARFGFKAAMLKALT